MARSKALGRENCCRRQYDTIAAATESIDFAPKCIDDDAALAAITWLAANDGAIRIDASEPQTMLMHPDDALDRADVVLMVTSGRLHARHPHAAHRSAEGTPQPLSFR